MRELWILILAANAMWTGYTIGSDTWLATTLVGVAATAFSAYMLTRVTERLA